MAADESGGGEMMRATKVTALCLGTFLVWTFAGCGGGVEQAQPRRAVPSITGGAEYGYGTSPASARPADQVQALEANYYGHQALKMTNGLVTIVAVPEFGGRIMEYKIGAKPLLWVNLAEVKASLPTERMSGPAAKRASGQRAWRNWGGYKVWPAPQERWQGPPDPPGSMLDGGRWVGRIVKPRGKVAEIELVSPADETVTGLQITRRVSMEVGSTHVRVEEIFKNVSGRAIEWSIWDVTQVPGSLAPDERFSEDARIYFPLNPDSRFAGGYRSLIDRQTSQWRTLDGNLLEVAYNHELGKIGADSTAGWIAYVDGRHQWAFVKRFTVEPTATYPDGGCTVEVFTSDALAYMEMEVLSPLRKLEPGEEMRFTEDWYATRLGAPIRDTSDVAAFTEPLRVEEKDGKRVVVGMLGVFAPGKLLIQPVKADGKPAGKAIEKAVSPVQLVRLSEVIEGAGEVARVGVSLRTGEETWQIATLSAAGATP